MGRLQVEAAGLQPLVESVHLLPAVLPEADVKRPRVGDFLRVGEVVQAQNEPRLVNQHDEGVALGRPRQVPEAKVRFEEFLGLRDTRNSEIEMVQCHVCLHMLGETSDWPPRPVAPPAEFPRRNPWACQLRKWQQISRHSQSCFCWGVVSRSHWFSRSE